MASTYTPIASTILSSPAASVTFSSISGAYTDLIVRISAASSNAATTDGLVMQLNGVTTNRSGTDMNAVSTTAGSQSTGNGAGTVTAASGTANTFGTVEIRIPNYANSSYNKPYYYVAGAENNSASTAKVQSGAGLWSVTTAITSVGFILANGPNFVTGSRFDLYAVTHF